jgi:N-acetylglucosaminyldiphosphoundecaprenol N-acetyl-beta-D-mannosaminyltransferase
MNFVLSKNKMLESQVRILNLPIHNLSMTELLTQLRLGGTVFTPNVDHIVQLQSDSDFYRIYQSVDYRMCDSQILMYASRFLGHPIREKISGSDLFPAFCDFYKEDESIKIFLLGSSEGIAQQAQRVINERIGRKIVIASHSPSYGVEKNEVECRQIIDLINQSGATVLAIGLGTPKQEKWIFKYKHLFKNIEIFLAIGATIDFEAGHRQRSPKWVSEVGLEWLFRIIYEPRRLWKRYLVKDIVFFHYLIKQKLNLYQDPFTSIDSLQITPTKQHSHAIRD